MRSARCVLRAAATVAIFEPDHVVELGRRDLEDIGVLDRDHAVAQAGRDVEWLVGHQLARARRLAIGEEDQLHPAAQQHDRLVLDAVILQRERLARSDVEDLADVAIGLGPDQLVAPGLVDDGHWLLTSWAWAGWRAPSRAGSS